MSAENELIVVLEKGLTEGHITLIAEAVALMCGVREVRIPMSDEEMLRTVTGITTGAMQ